jgi:6-pyruvoyltetrahydropterin/6-carboxytetrahydropterin synthase
VSRTTIERYHDFCAGHRVYGHENKCAGLHGHNYRVTFTVMTEKLDSVGRVLDFSVVNKLLCQWLEDNWDHKFLMWDQDPLAYALSQWHPSVSIWSFNPTAENMAEYLVKWVGPQVLLPDAKLIRVKVEETRKCSATYEL